MARVIDLKRRDFLRSTLAAAVLAGGAPPLVLPGRAHARSGSERAPFIPDLYVRLTAAEDEARILAGRPTSVWRYRGKVLKGNPRALEFLPGSFLPVMRVRRGQKVRIDLVNELPESTIIHWHGLYVPAPMDGHPRYAIGPHQTYVYEFEIRNRAGTYWFHPHPDGRTGKQVYFGMAGLFIVSDDEEAAVGLPSGPYDVPLVIQDRTFDSDNQLVYLSSQARGGMMGGGMMGGGMMAAMMGFLGDRILVNGKPDFVLPVEARATARVQRAARRNARLPAVRAQAGPRGTARF
ncbi:MAG TPA: multicopper oxidase domain-containing protein [Candidatus Binataceae bacterium]|nr:multicopper oxidase domain-containing protein [Candidatus Binataceae bacterium]